MEFRRICANLLHAKKRRIDGADGLQRKIRPKVDVTHAGIGVERGEGGGRIRQLPSSELITDARLAEGDRLP